MVEKSFLRATIEEIKDQCNFFNNNSTIKLSKKSNST